MPTVAETSIVNATAPSPNIKLRITDKDGQDITGARLGDELFLRIELDDDEVFGIFARELVAKSGHAANESIVLIDSSGCPTDPNIFPNLEKIPNSKGLMGKFDAFKFADDVVVRFQVNVQFCLQDCLPVNCDNSRHADSELLKTTSSYGRRKREVTLSDYGNRTELHREIIVEGIQNNEDPTNGKLKDDLGSSQMYCTSKQTLVVGFLILMMLEVRDLKIFSIFNKLPNFCLLAHHIWISSGVLFDLP